MALTLYYNIGSPPSRAVLLTMLNLGLEFESNILNLMAGEHKAEDYLKINPLGSVPAVVDDDFTMNESRAIMCYLIDSKSPGHSLYPSDDPRTRYIINQRLFFDATTWYQAYLGVVGPIMNLGETVIPETRKNKIFSVLNILEAFLEGYEWFSTTSDVSIADLSYLTSISTLHHIGLEFEDYPNIAAWYERCRDLPGFEENERGAKLLASIINSKLTEPF